jgi:hypothetical protein
MRLINTKIKSISILINFIPSLWKIHFFYFNKNGVTNRTFINVFLLGFQLRISRYKKFREVSIDEFKELIKKRKYESNTKKNKELKYINVL